MNTDRSYGSVAKWFHWITAVFFLASYCAVYFRHWFTEEKTSANWTALQLHLSIGISIAVIVILRVLWRNMNERPKPEPGSRLEQMAARLGHYTLYAMMMIIMPLTGYLGTGANTEFFFLFEIPRFEETPLFATLINSGVVGSYEEFEKPLDFIHKNVGGAWLVWMLILGHMGAALHHHFVKGDRTLQKMTTG